MAKFVESDGVISMLFEFPQGVISNSGRFYLPNFPWLDKKKFFAINIVSPAEMPASFVWDGQTFDYAILDVIRTMTLTLVDTNEADIVRDGVPIDYMKQQNNGQIREFFPQYIWTNRSHVSFNGGGFGARDAIIFQFFYCN